MAIRVLNTQNQTDLSEHSSLLLKQNPTSKQASNPCFVSAGFCLLGSLGWLSPRPCENPPPQRSSAGAAGPGPARPATVTAATAAEAAGAPRWPHTEAAGRGEAEVRRAGKGPGCPRAAAGAGALGAMSEGGPASPGRSGAAPPPPPPPSDRKRETLAAGSPIQPIIKGEERDRPGSVASPCGGRAQGARAGWALRGCRARGKRVPWAGRGVPAQTGDAGPLSRSPALRGATKCDVRLLRSSEGFILTYLLVWHSGSCVALFREAESSPLGTSCALFT